MMYDSYRLGCDRCDLCAVWEQQRSGFLEDATLACIGTQLAKSCMSLQKQSLRRSTVQNITSITYLGLLWATRSKFSPCTILCDDHDSELCPGHSHACPGASSTVWSPRLLLLSFLRSIRPPMREEPKKGCDDIAHRLGAHLSPTLERIPVLETRFWRNDDDGRHKVSWWSKIRKCRARRVK